MEKEQQIKQLQQQIDWFKQFMSLNRKQQLDAIKQFEVALSHLKNQKDEMRKEEE